MAIKDKSTLQNEKDIALASGQAGGITAAQHRGVDQDQIDSAANLAEASLQEFAGPINFNARVNLFGNGGVVPIYSSADIPTPGGVPTFLTGVTYEIQNPIPDWPSQGVLMEDFSCCFDKNMIGNTITMSGTGTMFYGTGSVYLRGLALDCPDGQFYDFVSSVDGEGIAIIEKNQNLTCAKVGNFGNHAITVMDFCKVDDAAQGLTFSGVNKQVHSVSRVAIFTTEGAGFVAIDQGSMVTAFLEYDLLTMAGGPGSVAFKGLPNSGNVGPSSVATFTGNNVLGAMTTLDGISEDDVGYSFKSVSGVKDSSVIGGGFITITQTTAITDGVDTLIAGIYSQYSEATQTDLSASGIITTLNRIPARSVISAVMEIDKLGSGTDTIGFKIQKDAGTTGTWVDIEGAGTEKVFQGAVTQTVSLRSIVEASANDSFRIVAYGVGTNDDIIANSSAFNLLKI